MGLSSQSYGFSSSHVWMRELDHKEDWVPKNWCFWTVVLERTLESPLDCKEIQSVHPKGKQSRIFIGGTDAEAEALILWPVQFSHSGVSDSLRPLGLQHARPPCPSPTPRGYWNSYPLSPWSHPTISSSVVPFSSHLQSFPASRSFQMNQFFTSGGQSIGVSASASVLPMNILESLLKFHSSKASILQRSAFYKERCVQLSHPYMTTEKTVALTRRTFVGKIM